MGVKIRKKSFFIILCIIIIILAVFVSAEFGFNLIINNDISKSVDTIYGNPTRIPVRVVNNDKDFFNFCEIQCTVYFDSQPKDTFRLSKEDYEFDNSYNIQSPSKGLDDETKSINIEARCSQVKSLLCTAGPHDEKNELFSITYKLTSEQRQAKDYVDSNLPLVASSLTSSDAQIKAIEDKLSQIGTNVKIGNIKSETSNLRTRYNNYKNEANTAKNYLEAIEFVPARNALRQSLKSDIDFLTSEAQKVDTTLKQILERHNKIAEKINNIGEINIEVKNLLRILGEENSIPPDIDNLINSFNQGDYDSYDSIETEINHLDISLEKTKSTLEKKISDMKSEANKILIEEIQTICTKYKFCLDITSKKDIEDTCSSLKGLFGEINKENQNREDLFLRLKERILKLNRKINNSNKEFEKMNEELKNKKIDIDGCNNFVKETNDIIKENKIDEIEEKTELIEQRCLTLKKDIQKEDVKERNFLSKFLGFLIRLFGGSGGQISDIETINEPEGPDIIKSSDKTKNFIQNKCDFDPNKIKEDYQIKKTDVVEREQIGESIGQAQLRDELCTVFGQTSNCCMPGDVCRSDIKNYPIIFIHGHSGINWNSLDYSISTFKNFQENLVFEGYVKAGIILYNPNGNTVKSGDWGKISKPMAIRTSYYQGVYDETGRTIGKEDGRSISIYSDRLKNVVDQILDYTDKEKIIIIAHSMGGLVARDYIKNKGGINKVHKLITLGSPHHGTTEGISFFCVVKSLTAAAPECMDMTAGSSFLQSLNSGDETPGDIEYISFYGTGCITGNYDSDGLIASLSAKLDGAQNIPVKGDCNAGITGFHGSYPNDKQIQDRVVSLLK